MINGWCLIVTALLAGICGGLSDIAKSLRTIAKRYEDADKD